MIVQSVLDCNNMCSSDVVLEEYYVVLRCFKWWMRCDDNDVNDDVRCVARVGCFS